MTESLSVALDNFAKAIANMPTQKMTKHIKLKGRCPHCSTPDAGFEQWWITHGVSSSFNGGPSYVWGVYACNSCGGMMLTRGNSGDTSAEPIIHQYIPQARQAHEDIPVPARTYLEQAMSTLHAPDASAVMSGSAVDSMLKLLGYEKGSVYSRIDEAVAEHKITENMGEWAHSVRLGANRPRHADLESPHVSPEEATQSLEFAEALAFFLFVLTRRIERGREAAAKTLQGDAAVDEKLTPPENPIKIPV
ncbi:DUF4145 domain-containing protein [Neorhizobium sp. T25_27]|uniref:DUF4145 domain-containing protein n=1 Tax=Neorhizobium sp. T25_27 TaxID=2093831 RepID=UPI000CF92A05|nr:DUF4145 domain-containing protein [Neorhizobium sp. T25_27]